MLAQRVEQQAKCFIQEGRSESTCIQGMIEILMGAPHNALRPSSVYQINAYGLCFQLPALLNDSYLYPHLYLLYDNKHDSTLHG